jgi:hypothetical protein
MLKTATRPLTAPIPLVALQPMFHFVRRYARERQSTALLAGNQFFDDAMLRMYAASEISLTLLVDHVLAPLMEPLAEGTVDVAEQIQLAVTTLYTLISTVTPPDVAVPLLSVHMGRRCPVATDRGALLVQMTLAVLVAGLADEALHLVVAMPRQSDGAVCVEVQTDVPGVIGTSDEARAARAQLEQVLAERGGEMLVVEQDGCWIVAVRLQGERTA